MTVMPPDVDLQVGMRTYGTQTAPCPARIRVKEDDFRVEEILRDGFTAEVGEGAFPLYRVEKRGIDSFHMARIVSSALKSRVSIAGIKDKKAATLQYLTPTSIHSAHPPRIVDRTFTAELVGHLSTPFTRDMIIGNRFVIFLRDPCGSIEETLQAVFETCKERRLPNFFGLQRFGARNPLTHRVGRALIHGDFKRAIEILVFEPRRSEESSAKRARELAAAGKFKEAYDSFSGRQDLERIALRQMIKDPTDFKKTFRRLPIEIRRFFVQAYQSYIFNLTLSRALESGLDISTAESGDNWNEIGADGLSMGKVRGVKEPAEGGAVPLIQLVGYAYRDYGSRFDHLLAQVMKEEDVTGKSFFDKNAQEISSEGGFRRAPLIAKDLESNIDEGGVRVSFSLGKGGYATTLMREVIKPRDLEISGFGN
ncbi:MAG: tRNA pseudouridine(13) synthase TruD [Thaumarchaeota archaeon]|nr:tRNA pseudouridine(13) synthase TruD [Nitrososphaerota archaeon]